MSTKPRFEGFAYCPELRRHHIFVDVPSRLDDEVVIVEDVSDKETPREKARIPLRFFEMVQTPIASHFNQRISDNEELKNCPRARFVRGKRIPLDLLLGRELLVLAWAIEPWERPAQADPVVLHIPKALEAWLGMPPEERWTLYRLTNAKSGHLSDSGKGWRRSLRYGLCGEIGSPSSTNTPAPRKKKALTPSRASFHLNRPPSLSCSESTT